MPDKIDLTVQLLNEGYRFIQNRCDSQQTDIIETRILGEKVICMYGEEAAELFYDTKKFERKNAAPKRIQKTLTGQNAVQGMDGSRHLHRKHLFTSMMDKSNQKILGENLMSQWISSIEEWEKADEIVLFKEANETICQVTCQWAGVPLLDSERKERAEDFAAMVDGFGAVGPRHWKGRRARTRGEEWMQGIIANVRIGRLKAAEGSPLYEVAFHKDENGDLLDDHIAAVEMINVIRPITATATFITFMALALHDNPNCRQILRNGDEEYYEMFVQEVRRYYPFTPFMAARVKEPFNWKEHQFPKGTLVLLDVYGTNHDERIWERPLDFKPERFKDWEFREFGFIPQGGGRASTGHRCPGEGIVIDLMKTTLDFLVNKIEYQVPAQDLSYNMSKIPTLPESGFIITKVKRKV